MAAQKSDIQKLKDQLKKKTLAKKVSLAKIVEEIKLTKEIAKLDSPLYDKRELAKKDTMLLDVIIDQISEAYAADDRKMSLVFGLGIIPNKILAIMKSIQFSKHEEKEELLMMTGLDNQIIEDTLDAMGNTSYFSKAAIEVVPAIPMDIDKLKELLETVAIDMKLVSELDLNKFNQANIDYQYKRAEVKAQEMYVNTQEYVERATEYSE